MKVALLFSGHLRSLEHSIANFKKNNPNFSDPSLVDVYIHTWKGENLSSWQDKKHHVWDQTGEIHPAYLAKLYSIDMMKENFNIADSMEDDFEKSPPYEIFKQDKFIGGTISMAYGWKSVFSMMEKSEKNYDFVIRTRPDLRYEIPFEVNVLKEKLDSKERCALFPFGHDFNGITDIISVAKKDQMKLICGWYDWLMHNMQYPEFVKKWHPETFLKYYIDQLKFNIERFDLKHGLYRYVEYGTEKLNLHM